ncbi:MAG: hypothetical protein ACTJHU_09955, partial [Mycetocola sp.]
LLSDHTRSEKPFSYDDDFDRRAGLALLQDAIPPQSHESPFTPDYVSEKVELRNLIEGFRILAKHLKECQKDPDKYQRSPHELPDYDGKTELKQFLLRSTVAFLDLSQPSQDRIIDGLNEISTLMTSGEVFSVRNDYAHYRRIMPNVTKMEVALESVRQSVTRIENFGFCRISFAPSSVRKDNWGYTQHEFVGPRSYEHIISRPTSLDWMGLPSLNKPQYLLRSASFTDPNEVLRFTRRYGSDFSEVWSGFPNRRRSRAGTQMSEDTPAHDSDLKHVLEADN